MDTKLLPQEVDCIIIGTGLINSIVAAACSRIGKSVLHVDTNNYYGQQWASFTFQQLIDWIRINYPDNESCSNIPEELVEKSVLFCIDLCPKLLNSNGDMVNLLVQSNVARYHEFKNNIRILSMIDNQLHVLPCQRSEVFTSPLLSDLVDKRRMMKFFELCSRYEPGGENIETKEIEANADKPIAQFLEERKLKRPLRELIINSIAMVSRDDPLRKACENIKNFIAAIERFGRSPFLFPIYGCGEFPQSFCRLSAVFGGTYCLKTKIKDLIVENKREADQIFSLNLKDHEHPVRSRSLVIDYSTALDLKLTASPLKEAGKLSRAIIITNHGLVSNPDRMLSFLRLFDDDNTVYLLELNSSVMVCPHDFNIIYLWTKSSSSDATQDLSPTVERIVSCEPKLKILWKFYYQQPIGPLDELESDKIENLHVTNPPSSDTDYSYCIEEAKRIFQSICPDEQFLPRAPDPDEIIT